MVIINRMKVESKFMYLWLKYVNGVDLKVHCAKSLLGEYSKKISTSTKEIDEPIELNEAECKAYYLCGVSKPYNWSKNFHLAFKEKDGARISIERNGILIEIENAEEIPISAEYINPLDPNANKKAYYTCRNWQFAYMMKTNNI